MTGVTARPAAPMSPIRLHLNECPYPPPPSVTAAMAAAAAHVNRYPPPDDASLMTELAAYCGAAKERIVLTSGSNELLHLLPLIAGAIGPETEIVMADPSFPTYGKVAGFYGVTVRNIPVTESGAADVEAMLAAITPACRLVCVPSPNNPTGGMLSAQEIAVLAAGVPDTTLLHFDEAYYEFGREAGGVETLPLLSQRQGLWIASRSFSKAFGLAGIRLGCSITGSDALAERCRGLRPNFSVNGLAQAAGLAALRETGHYRKMMATISAERERLRSGLADLGLAPLPSAANFVAFPAAFSLGDLAAWLGARGILVGQFDLPGAVPAIRATVGTRQDTEALLAAIAACMQAREHD